MSTNRKTRNEQTGLKGFSRMEKFHPFKTFMFFGIVGSTVLFLSMAFLYFLTLSRSGTPENFVLPKAFSVSTVFLMLSSYSLSTALSAYKNDSFHNLKLALWGTIICGTIFCISQVIGCKKMIDEGFFISSNVGVSYLFVITGIHFLHVAGGMIYMMVFTSSVMHKSGDIAKSLMFLTDEFQKTKLQLTIIYWHFVDILWLLLFFMFLFTF